MKNILLTSALLISMVLAAQTPIDQKALDLMVHSDWSGTLEYRDYSSDKRVQIPVALQVERVSELKYRFSYNYSDEPHANSSSVVSIGKGLDKIGKAEVLNFAMNNDGTYTIVAGYWGKDNNKKKYLKITYLIGLNIFEFTKEVGDSTEQANQFRNKYSFSR